MVFLCHGLAKSASSFAFHLASGIAEAAGFPQAPLYERYIPDALAPFPPQPYFLVLSQGALRELSTSVPSQELLVVKVHGPMYVDVAELLAVGECRGLSTYRDPRDAAVSLFESAHRERRKVGESKRSAFTDIETIEQGIDVIADRLDEIRPWLESPNVLRVAYEALRRDPMGAAKRIGRHMGLEVDTARVVAHFLADKRRIREFNVGGSGRFKTVLSVHQEETANALYADFLERIQDIDEGIRA